MAEYKQYITQVQDNGKVMISEDVVATIVEHALVELDGVAGLDTKPGADIADLIGKKTWARGLKIQVAENNDVIISCNVVIYYGHSVVEVANAVQAAVSSNVESMTGVKVQKVNVNVCGIVRQ